MGCGPCQEEAKEPRLKLGVDWLRGRSRLMNFCPWRLGMLTWVPAPDPRLRK